MLVRGPSQCGKTTVLSLLERTALAAGIETARFDPQPPTSDASPGKYDADMNVDDADSALAASELLQAAWGTETTEAGANRHDSEAVQLDARRACADRL